MPTAFSISLPSGVFDDLVNDLPTAPGSLPRMLVEVAYAEDVRPLDEREEGSEPEIVARTARQELSQVGTVVMNLGNPVNGALLLSILKSDGSSVVQHAVSADDDEADYTVTSADVELLVQAEAMDMAQPTSVVNVRNAQLVPIGAVRPDFKSASFGVLTVNTGEEAMLGANGPLAAFGFAAGRSSSVELSAELASKLTDLTWRTVPLAVDGRFTAVFEQPILKEGTPPVSSLGWVWWLNGSRSAVGFVTDDVSAPNRRAIIVALPAMQPRPGDAAVEDDCDCHGGGKSVSLDVTEAELVNNPGVYSEDPGSFCKPFNNPERVVGEKAFAVVARVETPDISPVPSSKLRSQHLLDIDPEEPAEVKPDGRGGAIVVMKPPTKELMMTALMKKSRAVVRFKESAATVKETKEMPSGRTTMSADQPLQWEDDMAQYQAVTVAKGHILEFRVRTRSNGYSLGNVASTLTLAPRQTKRIQKVEFERMERARRDERTQQADSVSDDVTRERDYNDTVSAYLSEWATGSSSSSTAAAAGGIGFCIPPVVGGVGGGTSTAWSDSSQEGERNTGASEQQRLRDSIRRHGDALRSFQSSVVTEITQQETVTGTTEILRNPNYGHSLTVIYYQILRHLKVSTEFAGVRECLFVPFAIKPFTLQRAYRWREAIGKYLRVPRFKKALKHLRDVITDFEHSDIPDGPRKNQRLTYLRGSLYITLAIERPKDTAEGAYDAAQWLPFASFFGAPAFGIWSKLSARAAEMRDQFFQREHAPAMAAKWVNKLSVQVNGAPLQADFTLASRYGFNQTVRVDFSVAGSRADDFTRAQLTEIVVKAEAGLPPGSVANAKRMSLRFGTMQFERTIEAEAGVDDIVVPETGEVDTTGALMSFPLEAWDEVDERAAIKNAVNELVEHLNEHVEFYHKAIWWSMDRDRLMMMLDGFFVPGSNNQSIASVVDREPVAIIGNSLVYRVGAGSFLGIGNITKPAELYAQYAGREPAQDPLLISLPTDGLYAQTIMDECLALEEHQGSVDWVLNDPDPDLGTIDPSLMMSRRADVSSTLTPTQMPTTIINLQNAPDAPAPTGLGAALTAVGNGNAFRDMAGLAGTQQNAAAALQTAASLATNFGNQAAALKMADMAKNKQATEDANKQMASVQKAKDQGLISDADAAGHTNKILGGMHTGGGNEDSVITGRGLAQQIIDSGQGGSISESNPTGTRVVDIKPPIIAGASETVKPNVINAGDLLATAGAKDSKEYVILVGGTSNTYNGYGKWVGAGAGSAFTLNPAPATLADVDDYINAAKGNETHDKYWADFLEPVSRLITNKVFQPKPNDIVTVMVYYPPYLKRQERDWKSSPWNTAKWRNSPWVAGKDPYDATVRLTEQGSIPTKQTPTTPVKSGSVSTSYATQLVSEQEVDHEILMRSTNETILGAQTYAKRPRRSTEWMDAIHDIPRLIVYGPMLGGTPKLRMVMVKVLLVSEPQQILDYMADGKVTNGRYWQHLLDTHDEDAMASAESPSLEEM
ncbi:MAG: hypothetical protein IPO17_16235 [Flavobacteriales bacterium]|nr:hypothetical protein [Flavobacteriales bacterium]